MSKEEEELKKTKERNEEVARNTWDSWIVDLEEQEQPETCGIDDDDCEACGS
jgi:hypothetical protein|tara:strand:- start:223 stop:378 length:156 start_codon:yes stop_codon:yes gene_type:complete